MKRLLLLGPSRSGKTTLLQRLRGEPILYRKTQSMVFDDYSIDSPGEYIENRHFYSALTSVAFEADIVGLVQNIDSETSYFAPMFAVVFNRPVIGIVSKTDIPVSDKQRQFIIDQLKQAGADPLFFVSATQGEGLTPLLTYLE